MQTVAIEGTVRTEVGTKYAKAARKEGNVPCVMYGGDEVVHFQAHTSAFKKLVYTSEFRLAQIEVDGKIYKALLKDVQYHPITDNIMHVDFIQLVDGKPLKVEVPVIVKGSSPGVKVGGKLQQSLRKVKIMATPETLVDNVTVDVSKLELGQAVRVRDIALNDGVEILNPPANPVAMVEIPRALRSAMMEAAKEEAKAAKKKKK